VKRLEIHIGTVVWAALILAAALPSLGATPVPLLFFHDAPPDALIRQLQPAEAGEATPHVHHKCRWLPEAGAVLVETAAGGEDRTPLAAAGMPVVTWTFKVADGHDALRYRELTYRNDTWYDSTYWTGPNWTRVGKDWHHPGIDTPAVRRFATPRDGRVTISGRIYKLDTKPSDGVRLAIRHNAKTVWQAEIGGSDATGVEPNVTLDVRKGDQVRFVVHKRGDIFCDTTHWDPVIAYADGPRFRASEGFSTEKQGAGGWSYEMEVDPQQHGGLPRLHWFDHYFSLRHATLAPGETIELTATDSLPLWVLSDGADRTGIALAALSQQPWRLRTGLDENGELHITLSGIPPEKSGTAATAELPQVVLGAYEGRWVCGFVPLQKLLSAEADVQGLSALRAEVAAAFRGADSGGADMQDALPELDFWAMIQDSWQQEDKLDETPQSYAAATAAHLDKARRLLSDIRAKHGPDLLTDEAQRLDRLAAMVGRADTNLEERRSLYTRVRILKRRIALANPLMDFGKLLFCRRVPTSYSHLVMQYYGWRARPGGGLFVLQRPGRSLACRDILEGRLAGGSVLEPRLSYDGRRVVFSYVDCPNGPLRPEEVDNQRDVGCYHIYEANVDGTGLRRLTSGPFDDLMPTWLPDGGIAFSSTRRRGYARCFGGQFSRRWHVYTLHRIDGDGSNLRALSFHDTNEWFPAVSETGRILYARWDYIDRDAVTHQTLWAIRPDGTNPAAVWGNATPSPHCTFQIQPILGTGKIVFTASAHHSIAGGSIAVVDPSVADNGQAAITRITPEIPFPEAEGRNIGEYYTAPWPLSDRYFLVGYSPKPLVWEPGANDADALGIYLLDVFGNRELIYRDPAIGSTNPCPLRPRPVPPVIPSELAPDAPPVGEMTLADVYQGLGDVPRDTIKQLRIVQIFPKTTNVANSPPIGMAREENGRAILGTVPVEADGSARFLVPAGKPILFQALDQDGFAYQTMRSVTYVQPGERVSCVGCHESRLTSPLRPAGDLVALARPPSRIDPGELGGRPFSYVEVVQPILDRHCVRCHGGEKTDGGIDLTATPYQGFNRSYVSLCGDVDFWGGGTNPQNAAKALVPRFGGRNQVQVTPPGGKYGARGSRLMRLLREGHEDVKLSADELRRLATWIDFNAIFYGVNLPEDQARQLRGERVEMPEVQ